MQQRWVDYYSILQVQQDDAREAIEAKYKTLCKTYHPDINSSPGAEDLMKDLNLAWEVLRDENKRMAFHYEWRRRNMLQMPTSPTSANKTTQAYAKPSSQWTAHRPPKTNSHEELASRRAITQYFACISKKNYDQAYHLLSHRDRRNIPQESFTRWQVSVAASYTIQSFSILFSKQYDAFPLGDAQCPADRYSIEITEKDLKTMQISQYRLVKFVIQEGDAWHIFLGYRDLDYVVEQFSFLSGTSGEAVRRTTDPRTGLPNREGFLEKCRPEAYRCDRYSRDCVLGIATIQISRDITDPDLLRRILQQAGFSLRATVRLIDHVGSLDQQRFCFLLAETTASTAKRAIVRIARKVEQDILACFDIQIHLRFSLCAYDHDNLSKTLTACEK